MAKRKVAKSKIESTAWAIYSGRSFRGRIPAARTSEEAIKKFKKFSCGAADNLELHAVPLSC